jgi:hypothetical protein
MLEIAGRCRSSAERHVTSLVRVRVPSPRAAPPNPEWTLASGAATTTFPGSPASPLSALSRNPRWLPASGRERDLATRPSTRTRRARAASRAVQLSKPEGVAAFPAPLGPSETPWAPHLRTRRLGHVLSHAVTVGDLGQSTPRAASRTWPTCRWCVVSKPCDFGVVEPAPLPLSPQRERTDGSAPYARKGELGAVPESGGIERAGVASALTSEVEAMEVRPHGESSPEREVPCRA